MIKQTIQKPMRYLSLALLALGMVFSVLPAHTAHAAACAVVNGICSATGGACTVGTVTADDAASACNTTRHWGCIGSGGGTTATCTKANAACPVCGGAANTCSTGSASGDNGQTACGTTRSWSCSNGGSTIGCSLSNAACIAGVCNNSAAWQCNTGSGISGSCGGGNYLWYCQSPNGGANSPQCSTNAISWWTASCGAGGLGDWGGHINGHSDNCLNVGYWDSAPGCCLFGGNSNTTYYPNGVPVAGCNATVNGSCNNGSAWACNSGNPNNGYDPGCGGTRTWTCDGSYGGTTDHCSQYTGVCPINGSCGGSYQACASGSLGASADYGCGSSKQWWCNGSNGGTNILCSINNAACGGTCGAANNNYYASKCGCQNITAALGCGSGSFAGLSDTGSGCTWNCSGTACSSGYGCVGGGGGGGCFLPNTLVALADGKTARIDSLKVGDKVKGAHGINTVRRVSHYTNTDRMYGINGGKAFVTAEHPFTDADGTLYAIDPELTYAETHHGLKPYRLSEGTTIATAKGPVAVESITPVEMAPRRVYNLTVDGDSGYYANGYLMHNVGNDGGGFGGKVGMVTMADGSTKALTAIKVGDKVRSESGINTVKAVYSHRTSDMVYSINGSQTLVTGEHMMLTTDGWRIIDPSTLEKADMRDAEVLQMGDELVLENGKTLTVTSIEPHRYTTPTTLRELELDGDHTYFMNGMLVHNPLK